MSNKDERNWTASQLYAIESREKDLLLSAGAGSGKTATLTERVCRLICDEENGVDVSRMLIVTFTKAAAEELKDRVRKALEAKLEKNPSSQRLEHQMLALDHADISTISAFFLKSIKPYFSQLGLPPAFGVADEDQIKIMKKKIISDTIDDFFDEGDDAFIALADSVSSSRDETSMNDAILALADRLDSKGIDPETLDDRANALSEGRDDFLSTPHGKVLHESLLLFAEHYSNLFGAMCEILHADENVYSKYGESAEYHKKYSDLLLSSAQSGTYKEIREVISVFAAPKLGRLNKNFQTFESNEYKNLKDQFGKDFEKISPYFAYSEDEIREVSDKLASVFRSLSSLIGEYRKRLAEEKLEMGVVDYGDIELFAKRLFVSSDGSPTDAAREIASKYDFIFIDEYQDTNRIQDAVFSAISDAVPRFMVGDVKQSIYAFRGAEPSIFVSYREKMPKVDVGANNGPAPLPNGTVFMSENFRSDSTVIDFVNAVSEYMFPGTSTPFESGDRLIFSKKQIEGYRETPVEVVLVEDPELNSRRSFGADDEDGDDEDEDVEDVLPEAEFVAEKVVDLLKNGKRGNGEPIKEGDITILLRSKSGSELFENALKQRGVRVADRASEEFFEQKEILLVLSLLNCIDNPQRDIYLAGAMKSPVFGFTLNDLIKIRTRKTDVPLWYCVESYADGGADGALSEKCRSFIKFVNDFRRKTRGQDSATLLRTLYDDLSLYSLTDAESSDSMRATSVRENLRTLYDLARRYEASSFGGLYGFITYVDGLMEKSVGTEAAQDKESVSIMTIHKSKGLEFPVCILAKCGKRFNKKDLSSAILFDPELGPAMKLRDETGLVKFGNPIRSAVSRKLGYELICEETRTLYVALTRAMEKLIVCMTVKNAEEEIAHTRFMTPFRSRFTVQNVNNYKDIILPAALREIDGGAAGIQLSCAYKDKIGFSVIKKAGGGAAAQDDGDLVSLFKERLSFNYPGEHLINIPAKVTVSKLTPSLLDDEDDGASLENAIGSGDKRGTKREIPKLILSPDDETAKGTDVGIATHVFMQFCDFERLSEKDVEGEISRLVEHRFITPKTASLINREQIAQFASSPLFEEIRKALMLKREFRFNVFLPACDFTSDGESAEMLRRDGAKILVQGIIDIVFESADGRLILIDYKTDRLSKYELSHPEEAKKTLAERHRTQLNYYRAACEKIFERAVDKVALYSLSLGDTVDIF